MINGNLTNLDVQTLFVSKEQSICPLIPDIVRFGKKIKDLGLLEDTTAAVVSLKYGKRLIINGSSSNIGDIKIEDILEIVDYNPTKKIISQETWDLVDKLLLEKIPIAGISRVTGISEPWLQKYINNKYENIEQKVNVVKKKAL